MHTSLRFDIQLWESKDFCSNGIVRVPRTRPPRPTCRFQRVTTPNNVCIIFLQPFEQFWCTLLGFVLTILPWAGITLISVAESGWRKPRGEPTGLYSSGHPGWTYPRGLPQICILGLVLVITLYSGGHRFWRVQATEVFWKHNFLACHPFPSIFYSPWNRYCSNREIYWFFFKNYCFVDKNRVFCTLCQVCISSIFKVQTMVFVIDFITRQHTFTLFGHDYMTLYPRQNILLFPKIAAWSICF